MNPLYYLPTAETNMSLKCLNIEVTGSGTDKPEGVVGTSLYKADEDGIIFNPYAAEIKYNIPGPALYSGASGSGSTAPKPSATAPAATSAAASATAPAATSAVAEATPTASAAPAPSSGASLPKTFTLDTFVAWLEKTAGESKNARRHARSLF
jgi:cellulase